MTQPDYDGHVGPDGWTPPAVFGARIECVRLNEVDDSLRLVFEDGVELAIGDRGQQCCETRYLTCDDDLTGWTGARLLRIEVRDAPPQEVSEPGVSEPGAHEHDVQFLHVITDQGTIVCETHNEHSGYYAGFNVVIWTVQ